MTLILKEHVRATVLTVSLCDSELIGRELEEGKLYLNLKGSFYEGEECTKEEAIAALSKAKSGTIVGEESVAVVKEAFEEVTVQMVDGVPFVNLMRI